MRIHFAAVLLVLGCGCGQSTSPTPASQQAATLEPEREPKTSSSAMQSSPALLTGRLVDLTHPFDEHTIYWPTAEGFKLILGDNGITAKGYYYAANRFSTAEHGGTHLDAPIHFFAERKTTDQVPLEKLIGEAAVIDVADKCADNPDYLIGVEDLHAWEEAHGRQLVDLILLLKTNWSRHWPDAVTYLGTNERGPQAVAKLHFPGLAPEAARWLVEQRSIKAIGIDTASIDYGQSTHFESHILLCGASVPIFENVAHLDQLPGEGALVIALPMKIAGGSGGPLRIVAVIQE